MNFVDLLSYCREVVAGILAFCCEYCVSFVGNQLQVCCERVVMLVGLLCT